MIWITVLLQNPSSFKLEVTNGTNIFGFFWGGKIIPGFIYHSKSSRSRSSKNNPRPWHYHHCILKLVWFGGSFGAPHFVRQILFKLRLDWQQVRSNRQSSILQVMFEFFHNNFMSSSAIKCSPVAKWNASLAILWEILSLLTPLRGHPQFIFQFFSKVGSKLSCVVPERFLSQDAVFSVCSFFNHLPKKFAEKVSLSVIWAS